MKKIIAAITGTFALFVYLSFNACKHDDNNPCSGTFSISNISATLATNNKPTGTITVVAKGGSGFQYSLDNTTFQDSGFFNNLTAKDYTVYAKNSSGCTDDAKVTVGQAIDSCFGITIVLVAAKTDATGGLSNGTITVTATGGSSLQYQLNSGPFQTSNTFTGLAPGTYTVTAKNQNGCTSSTQVTVGSNACSGVTIGVTATKTDAGAGQSNGSITVTATGGTGFTYQLGTGAFQASNVFTGLAAGTYTVTAKSAAGCSGSTQVVIASVACQGVTIGVTATKVDPVQNQSNGSITVTATGGTGFTYQLNTGAFQASNSFTGLAAGTYTVTAKSAAGCTGSTQITLTGTNPCTGVTITVTATKTDPQLNQSNGSIVVTATGGTGLTYQLNGGAFQASNSFTGLPAGTYTVTAKTSAGCTGSTQIVLVGSNPCTGVTITVSATKTDPGLNQSNGTITAVATGSTGFTYQLNNGAFQSSGTFTGLAAGTYTITAKNSNGCTGSTQIILVNPCAGITITVGATKTDPAPGLSNGTITATATGSTGFTYQLNGGAFQSSGTFTGLAAGTYTITAKTAAGCTGSTQITLVNPCTGVTISVSLTKTDALPGKSTGKINVTASGGTGPYTYQLNSGAFQSSASFTGLAAGSYTVTAKSAAGCTGQASITIASDPCAGKTIVLNTSITNVVPISCGIPQNNGSITISATGSTGFTYSFDNGATYSSMATISNLYVGTYNLAVKDVDGCVKTKSVNVTNAPAGPLYAAVKGIIASSCSGVSCHTNNGGANGGVSFDTDCNILDFWSDINQSAVVNGDMPPSGSTPLTQTQKNAITNWINAGHTYDK
jgi:large repetitive protein